VLTEPQTFALTVADLLLGNTATLSVAFTGFTASSGPAASNSDINYGESDLSDLGVAIGASVTSIVVTSVCEPPSAAINLCTEGDLQSPRLQRYRHPSHGQHRYLLSEQ
jgi:hypothetical protein